jgi:hypothetical protein
LLQLTTEKGPGWASRDPCFFGCGGQLNIRQVTDIKELIFYVMMGWLDQDRSHPRPNLVNTWREYGRDGVTIGKKA